MNLIGFKREPEEAFYLRLRGSCGASWPQLSHPSPTSTEGHRPRNTHQGFSPLHCIVTPVFLVLDVANHDNITTVEILNGSSSFEDTKYLLA
jgi:hypothetical protein